MTLIVIGGAVALWTASGAASALMRAQNRVYDTDDTRGFVRQRLIALAMVLFSVLAFLLVFGLLILGPKLSGWIGEAFGAEAAVRWVWLLGEWPILVVGLLVAFGTELFLGPDVERARAALRGGGRRRGGASENQHRHGARLETASLLRGAGLVRLP